MEVYNRQPKSDNEMPQFNHEIRMKSAKVNAFKYSFFVRIIKEWNNSPQHLLGKDINVNKFKYNLKTNVDEHKLINPPILILFFFF